MYLFFTVFGENLKNVGKTSSFLKLQYIFAYKNLNVVSGQFILITLSLTAHPYNSILLCI